MNDTTDIKQKHPKYKQHEAQVALCNDIYNGYDTAIKHIVASPNENDDDYRVRVELSTFDNVTERIITAMVGQIYRKPLQYKDVPDNAKKMLDDMNFEAFIKDATTMAIRDGKTYIYIDLPETGGEPYLAHVTRQQVINWERDAKGNMISSVIHEQYEKRDGFRVTIADQYRHVKQNGDVDIWREVEGEGFVVVKSIETTYDFFPIVEVDVSDIPPVYDIAIMNKNLFNSASMTANAIRKATDPSLLLVGLGVEAGDTVKLGVNATINTDNPDARVEWVELKGESIPVAKQDLADQKTAIIERALAMQQDDGNKTATQVNRENAESNARLTNISFSMEKAVNEVYDKLYRLKFLKGAVGDINYAYDFTEEGINNSFAKQLASLYVSGAISQETLLNTLVEKEQIIIDGTVEDEVKRTIDEGVESAPVQTAGQ